MKDRVRLRLARVGALVLLAVCAVEPCAAASIKPVYDSGACVLREDLCLTDDGTDDYIFVRPVVGVDNQGNIFVYDRKVHDIRKFDPDGNLARRFGRLGEGPGEFGDLSIGMTVMCTGQVIITDFMNARITMFDNDGEYVKDAKLPQLTTIFNMGSTDDGALFCEMETMSANDLGVFTYRLVKMDEDLNVVGVIDSLESRGMAMVDGNAEWLPYREQFAWAVASDGRLAYARGGEYRIRVLSTSLEEIAVIERDVDRVPVSSDNRRHYIDESRNDRQLETRSNVDIGDWKPPIVDMVFDDAGYLLVCLADADDSDTAYDVYRPNGEFHGHVTLPPVDDLTVLRNGFAYFVRTFEVEPPEICRGRIVPARGQ